MAPTTAILLLCALLSRTDSSPKATNWLVEQAAARRTQLTLQVTEVRATSVAVRLRNVTQASVNLPEQSNSWGAACWRIVRIRNGQSFVGYQTLTHGFTVNVPTTHSLAPGATWQQVLDLTKEEWKASGANDLRIQRGDIIVVTYDVPYSDILVRANAWFGVVGGVATAP